MIDFNNIYSRVLDCTGSLGLFKKTLVSHSWTKLCNIMLWLLTQLPVFEDSSLLYIVALIHLHNIRGLVPVLYDVLKYCNGASVPVY